MPWSQFDRLQETSSIEAYRAIIEGVPAMLWLGDEQGRCLFLNRAQREFWGVSNESISQFDWTDTLHPDDVGQLQLAFADAMTNRESFEVEARYKRSDGVFRILHTSARPRFAKSGEFLGMSGVNTDVTEQRSSEQRVTILTDELSHRMKNLFAVVGALVSATRRENPDSSAAFDQLKGRLLALSAAYQETHDLAGMPSAKSLHELAELVVAPYQKGNRISMEGLDVSLSPRGTAALALILNELATNSAKYGSLAGTGSLELSAQPVEEGAIALTWLENDVTKGENNPCSLGFGSQLLAITSQDIGAELTREWMGRALVIRILIPRSALVPVEKSNEQVEKANSI